ncbi:MAG: type I polyketide synthase, partial [Cyanobacteria bacterium P01_F01_bin.42]
MTKSIPNSNSVPLDQSSDRVVRALRDARAKLEAVEREKNERIAIIGMSGRFPGAEDVHEFWEMIRAGQSGIRLLSDEELLEAGVDRETFEQPEYVRAYANVKEPDGFDAKFFGYSPREAEVIDPQHRLFLECAWSALEDAGYDSQRYDGDIGVYGGSALNSYVVNLHNSQLRDSLDNVQVVVSNVMGLMPTRVSYKLDLTGPSLGVQTGCSTSLVAVHTACQSLRRKECDMALAGGVTITTATPEGYLYQADGIASPDGRCRAFDAKAQGTVFGNGVGIVVLKRLQAAIADGDHIYAVIQGSAINNDGANKVGLTAPSVQGQAKVVSAALKQAGIDSDSIGYIETHGTGTALGDPIEVSALSQAFRQTPNSKVRLGSVKTNIGHLDAAAGVAGLIKTALVLHHQTLPPILNFEQPNPKIEFDSLPFSVQTTAEPWTRNGTPRRAGVSSFGMGGTNAHAILEEAPEPTVPESNSSDWQLLPVSAKTESALAQIKANLNSYLQASPQTPLSSVAYTLQVGRRRLDQRQFFLARTHQEAIAALSSDLPNLESPSNPPEIAFLFSGQGSQYLNMGKELYKSEPLFRSEIDRCEALLDSQLDVSLTSLIFSEESGSEKLRSRLKQTAYAQPALLAVEYALAKLWMSWGIEPRYLLGHSLGDYTAACLAGVMELEDALMLVTKRGQLMQQCPTGGMLSIALSESDVKTQIDTLSAEVKQSLVLSVSNGPQLSVVSGTSEAIAAFQTHLEQQDIHCQILHTSHGFHSPMMEPALAEFLSCVQSVQLSAPEFDIISSSTGTWLSDKEATDPNYWVQQIRQPVRFKDALETLRQHL